MAIKRGAGRKPTEFDERFMAGVGGVEADEVYEQGVFRAKVCAAIRKSEAEADFLQFQVYRMRVFDDVAGKHVAEQLGISEPTVSRHLHRVRALLRRRLGETVATYSFTEDEQREPQRRGLGDDDAMFDDALREIYHEQARQVLEGEGAASGAF